MELRELGDELEATIRRVWAGEFIEITIDGEPVAVLSPLLPDRVLRLAAEGGGTIGRPLTRPLRGFPVTGPLTASEALEEDRG